MIETYLRNEYNAGMTSRQYTIRSVPDSIDRELRRLAAEHKKSLNSVVLESLEKGLQIQAKPSQHTDVDFLIGTWEDDSQFDEAIAEFERIDEGLWR